MPTDETHNPRLESWIESANDPATDFPIQSLPWCRWVLDDDDEPREGARIGDMLLDMGELTDAHCFDDVAQAELTVPNEPAPLIVAGLPLWSLALRRAIRKRLVELLRKDNPILRDNAPLRDAALHPIENASVLLPVETINDYTDFYASIHHAANVGSMFRPDNPLLPNYKWLPVGYHGRASSIVVSGEPVRRPMGQLKADDADAPVYAPTKLLDYELEVGFFVAQGNEQGEPIPIERAEEHILGLCLVNDWSARDMQKWEYQPLGPFLAKSFATSVSPYIVTMEALAPFRCPAFKRDAGDPQPLPHLDSDANRASGGVDLTLEVLLQSRQMRDKSIEPMRVSAGDFRSMYWTIAQMLAHHASNGCNFTPGDLLASGTVSGESEESRGCLLERTWRGQNPITLPTGETRKFLEDGDTVIMRGWCEREGYRRIGLGECVSQVLPAKERHEA